MVCKDFYSEEEISTLRQKAKTRQKLFIKEWKKNNPEKVSDHTYDWYSTHNDAYNAHRKKIYKEKNLSIQRAQRYQDDKRKEREEAHKAYVNRTMKGLAKSLKLAEDGILKHFTLTEDGDKHSFIT